MTTYVRMERRDEGGQGRDPFAGARRCTQHALSAIVKYIATKVVPQRLGRKTSPFTRGLCPIVLCLLTELKL